MSYVVYLERMSHENLEDILMVTTSGTIDKVYFDQKSDY